jgi:hypothetical protein
MRADIHDGQEHGAGGGLRAEPRVSCALTACYVLAEVGSPLMGHDRAHVTHHPACGTAPISGTAQVPSAFSLDRSGECGVSPPVTVEKLV